MGTMSDNVQLVSLPWNMSIIQESLTWTLFMFRLLQHDEGMLLAHNAVLNCALMLEEIWDMENLRFFAEGFISLSSTG